MDTYLLVLAFLMVPSSFRSILTAKAPFLNLLPPRNVLKIEYFENCDKNVYPFMVANFTFARNGSVLIMTGHEIVSRDLKPPNKVQLLIDKCKDKSNPDTCEYYTTWKFDDMCLAHKLPFLKIFVDAHKPPMTCPLKKNHYYVKGARIPTDLVDMFLPRGNPNVLWKFRIKMEEEPSTVVACIDIDVRLMVTRARG